MPVSPVAWIGNGTYVQLEDTVGKKWVELPDCDGSENEIVLNSNVDNGVLNYDAAPSNAAWATCKKRGETIPDQSAARALDSVTPTAE